MEKTTHYDAVIKLPKSIADIRIAVKIENERIALIDFVPASMRLQSPQLPLVSEVVRQIERYFDDPDWKFDLPTVVQGTEFQRKVWRVLSNIKSGETLTYGDVAKKLNSSPRAVGNACRHNPLPLIVPCHRVVSKTGLGGFSGEREGAQLALKKWLISHEQVSVLV